MEETTIVRESVSVAAAAIPLEHPKESIPREVASTYSASLELRKIFASLFGVLGICAVVWLALYAAAQSLPYVMVGSVAVYNAKQAAIEGAQLVDASKPRRVIVFGSSKVLSGFVPELFDRSVPGSSSYNLGLPATEHFMPELEKLLARGERPTHILVTIPWADAPVHRNTIFHFPDDDAAVLERAFPFRTWVHDSFILLYRSPQFGGVRQTYRQAEESIHQMDADRGYYFIAGESHYPNDELPSDFKLDTDEPATVKHRKVDTTTASFRRLNDLATKYNFRVLMVPTYYRPGQFAPVSAVNSAAAEALKPYDHFTVLGPDYYTLDRKYFSDLLHLNRPGARLYTTMLADLVREKL